jgi:ribonucleotide reductase beta subunit family protein with ferritin-like domain
MEPLLQKNKNRFVLFPIKYPLIWDMYKKQKRAFWTAEEIDFSADLNDWNSLKPEEQNLIENILAFFAGSDGIVFENINNNFAEEIQIPEARCCYGFQAAMENIHSETYSLMIDTLVQDENKKTKLFQAIECLPAVKAKAEWACKYLDSNSASFPERLLAFSIVEGVFFSGSFCVIFWLKNVKGLMAKALAKSNELIARDEGMHTEFAVLLYNNYVVNKISEEKAHTIFKEAIDLEVNFICESLKCDLIGMNKNHMTDYIKFVGDRLLTQLGYSKIYNCENPFSFMDTISLDGKSNFFEQRVTEYNRAEQLNSGISKDDFLDEF